MLNSCFACWLMNVFVVSSWLQHRVLAPDKHELYFPILAWILNILTLPFLIRVSPITFFRFLVLLKAVIGCSWNNSCRFLLVWRMFQFLQITAVTFGKNRLYVNINGMRFGSCCSWSFFVIFFRLLSAYKLFLIAHQQFYGRNLASKISLSVLLGDGQGLLWFNRFSLFEVLGHMGCCFLTILDALTVCFLIKGYFCFSLSYAMMRDL